MTLRISCFISFALMAACGSPEGGIPDGGRPDYANPDALVDTEWVLAHLDDPTVHLIDISSRRAIYEEGHLPGARFVQWDTELTNSENPVEGQILSQAALSELMSRLGVEQGHTVVFYDNARNLFAARGYWVMKYYGHEAVHVYNGGRRKWLDDGHELTTAIDLATPTRYVAGQPDPAMATDWQYVVASLDDENALFCDTRSADEYSGADVRADRGGNIPGSVNIEWTRNVRDDGTFLDAPTLAAMYREAGFTPDREIVTYCQTGVRGAHTWFVLSELLGYPSVRNYDGSWAEYGNHIESPIQGTME